MRLIRGDKRGLYDWLSATADHYLAGDDNSMPMVDKDAFSLGFEEHVWRAVDILYRSPLFDFDTPQLTETRFYRGMGKLSSIAIKVRYDYIFGDYNKHHWINQVFTQKAIVDPCYDPTVVLDDKTWLVAQRTEDEFRPLLVRFWGLQPDHEPPLDQRLMLAEPSSEARYVVTLVEPACRLTEGMFIQIAPIMCAGKAYLWHGTPPAAAKPATPTATQAPAQPSASKAAAGAPSVVGMRTIGVAKAR
jgi:hypothetical protein